MGLLSPPSVRGMWLWLLAFLGPCVIRSVLPLLSNPSTTENNEAALQPEVLESRQYCKGTNFNSLPNTRKKEKQL